MCIPLQTSVEDGRFAAALTEQTVVSVSDMAAETAERLEFRDAVVKMSIGACLCVCLGHCQWAGLDCV